ncbi:MAG TPA: mycofactocin system FadH/OYE family oxidoreductase 2 [Acidimicrobiales bacterium]|nr:mycofactocin system FadH/OYE family oxidoreductase 2 [Acidimicrobiales bacterium]
MTTSTRYPLLFSPLRLGPVTVPNRIVFSAHLTNYAEDGLPSHQHAAYYAARAAGGAGLVITEEHSVHRTDWPYEKLIHGFNPEVIPGYRRITEAVHRHGTPIFAQINHNGGQGSGMYTRLPVWAPSAVADPLFREVPKEVDLAEIKEIIDGYALVAGHCKAGGFDGVELQCSHSSIVRAFLSPATNLRTDLYGGSLEKRSRILLEIVDVVREAIGPDLCLGVRLCGDELIDRGTTISDAVSVAKTVQQHGRVDYLNTSIGVATASLFMIEASMHVPPGYASFIPSAIREAVDLPVMGVGRFKDPIQAERALEDGQCDLVGVVRGQIADAEFAAKALSGRTDDIRLCLSCNQECVGRMGLNRWLGCIENPLTGREARPGGDKYASFPSHNAASGSRSVPSGSRSASSERSRHSQRRRVLVVGAGPAGLQAAIAAAGTGHGVTVLERDDEVGGQVRLAATVPSRAELGDLVRNQLSECRSRGVEIRTGLDAGVEEVLGLGPDAVVVATGSTPQAPYWVPPSDANGPQVVDVRDVLEGRAAPSGDVLVVDELGFHQATSVAELLADRGCTVEIATPGMVVGQDLGITLDLETFNMRAFSKGIAQSTDLVVSAITEDGDVELLHHPTGRTESRRVDWVVLAVPPAPVDGLYFSLREESSLADVYRVGDCVAPRRAHSAVIEGQRVGASL